MNNRSNFLNKEDLPGFSKLLVWIIGITSWILAIGSSVYVVISALLRVDFNHTTAAVLIVGGVILGSICFLLVGRKPQPYWADQPYTYRPAKRS